jgi:hypothetical protein
LTTTLTAELAAEEKLIRRLLGVLVIAFAHVQAARATHQRQHWEALGARLHLEGGGTTSQ